MNGFTAADMSTAAANGFRDGLAAQNDAAQAEVERAQANLDAGWYARREQHARSLGYSGVADALEALEAAQPAAALEAVAYREWHQERGDKPMESRLWELAPGQKVPDGADPLYAAPVAAAPVDGPYQRIMGLQGIGDAADYLARYPGDDYAKRRVVERLAQFAALHGTSTPAAPGIDLRNAILQLQEDALHMKDPGDTVNAYNRVLALINASPKGGSTDAKDAARWRYIRRKLCLTVNGDGTCIMQVINLPASIHGWPDPGQVSEFCDTAIDAAMQATSAEVGA